ncbi:hypothetical protein Dthio_PD1552 [Desulfonatronospira thiodismutans ASO3-1]|uniref:CARDB domain-containing protein n=1 Tax=Desulfonatronospira thiodismutans ASO3-1 TaxID=555779 RepID=D6SN75_9BACT|nr:carboxypeptidase regulatory-like domain-containing protein [Desulfonatronospira thiodismutans]EFI34201.1 hypothetical protein Dthio_PD1552 [Desulfonatronospira thiodismutans ASO3-1]
MSIIFPPVGQVELGLPFSELFQDTDPEATHYQLWTGLIEDGEVKKGFTLRAADGSPWIPVEELDNMSVGINQLEHNTLYVRNYSTEVGDWAKRDDVPFPSEISIELQEETNVVGEDTPLSDMFSYEAVIPEDQIWFQVTVDGEHLDTRLGRGWVRGDHLDEELFPAQAAGSEISVLPYYAGDIQTQEKKSWNVAREQEFEFFIDRYYLTQDTSLNDLFSFISPTGFEADSIWFQVTAGGEPLDTQVGHGWVRGDRLDEEILPRADAGKEISVVPYYAGDFQENEQVKWLVTDRPAELGFAEDAVLISPESPEVGDDITFSSQVFETDGVETVELWAELTVYNGQGQTVHSDEVSASFQIQEDSYNFEFETWDDAIEGEYTASVTVDALNADSLNAEFDFEVLDPAPAFFSVQEVDAPDVVQGEHASVSVDIKNTGDLPGSQDILLVVDPDGEELEFPSDEPLELAGQEAGEVQFTGLDLHGLEAGSYDLLVITDNDEKKFGDHLNILAPAYFSIDEDSIKDLVIKEGQQQADFSFDVSNSGEVSGKQDIELVIVREDQDDLVEVLEDFNLQAGETKTAHFEISGIEDLTQGSYDFQLSTEDEQITVPSALLVRDPDQAWASVEAVDPVFEGSQEVTAVFTVDNIHEFQGDVFVAVTDDAGQVLSDEKRIDEDLESETFSFELFEPLMAKETLTVGIYEDSELSEELDSSEVRVPESARFVVQSFELDPVLEGDILEVTADILNTGELQDTQDIILELDGDQIASQEMMLGGGDSKEFAYNLDTSDLELQPGDYQLALSTDQDSQERDFTVLAEPYFDIMDFVDVEVARGQTVAISADIHNTGDVQANRQVMLYLDDIELESFEMTLEGGESAEFAFELDSSDVQGDMLDTGEYTLGLDTEDATSNALLNVFERPVNILQAESGVDEQTLAGDTESQNAFVFEFDSSQDGPLADFGDVLIENYQPDDLILFLDQENIWNASSDFNDYDILSSRDDGVEISFSLVPPFSNQIFIEDAELDERVPWSYLDDIKDVHIEVEHTEVVQQSGMEEYIRNILYPEQHTVSFNITDDNDESLENVNLVIENSDSYQVVTDEHGYAEQKITDGQYNFTARLPGYDYYEGSFEVDGDDKQIDLEMEEAVFNVVEIESDPERQETIYGDPGMRDFYVLEFGSSPDRAQADFGQVNIGDYSHDEGDYILLLDEDNNWSSTQEFEADSIQDSDEGALINFINSPGDPEQWLQIDGTRVDSQDPPFVWSIEDIEDVRFVVEESATVEAMGIEQYILQEVLAA